MATAPAQNGTKTGSRSARGAQPGLRESDHGHVFLVSDPGAMRLLAADTSAPAAPSDGAAGDAGGDGGGKPALRKWTALAYTGAPVRQWFGMLVLDLAGMRKLDLQKNPIPLLNEHGFVFREGETPRLGFIDAHTMGPEGLSLSGSFLRNERVAPLLEEMDQGFPRQFSIGPEIHKAEQLSAGATAVVNGRTITGPCEIAREWSLREGSVVDLGADKETRTAALSAALRAMGTHTNSRSLTMADTDEKTAEQIAAEEAEAKKKAEEKAAEEAKLAEEKTSEEEDAKKKAELATTPATIAQLRAALGGEKADPGLIVLCAEHGLTAAQATAVLSFANQRASAAAPGANPGDARSAALGGGPAANPGAKPGADAARTGTLAFTGAQGKDPAADWGASTALQGKAQAIGFADKASFCRWAENEAKLGIDWLTALAQM